MSKKAVETTWEAPVDDLVDARVAEEFRFRPHRLERVQAGNKKVGAHLYLDEDVLAYFQALAQQPDSPPWQTVINRILRQAMESSATQTKTATGETFELETLIESEPFVRAVADRIADRVANKLKKKASRKAA